MNAPGYEQLSEVLRAAFDQAAYGKGAERHARGNDFDKQHMQTISTLLGTERGMAFQVCKKLTEGLDMEAYDRFERELLGVIIYTAGIIIWRKKNNPPTAEDRLPKPEEQAKPVYDPAEHLQRVSGMTITFGELVAIMDAYIKAGDTGETYTEYEARMLGNAQALIKPADVDISDNSHPRWKDAPDWANYLAQDANGIWYWFECPIHACEDDRVWYEQEAFDGRIAGAGDAAERNPDWRNTRQARPTK